MVNTKTRSSGIINFQSFWFPCLGVPVSRRLRALVYMMSRDKVDVDAFHKGIQYALEKLGKSKFGYERIEVSNFRSKRLRVLALAQRHVGSGNEISPFHEKGDEVKANKEND